MLKAGTEKYQPFCQLSHDLINKLAVIVGQCDLLSAEARENSECARRLLLIREVAKSIADQLNHHQCDLEARIRMAETRGRSLTEVG